MPQWKIGDKVTINCPHYKGEKCKANGHVATISNWLDLFDQNIFASGWEQENPEQVIFIYEIEWAQEDNPGKMCPDLDFDFFYWMDEDFIQPPKNIQLERGLPPC